MVLEVSSEVTTDKDASGAVRRGVRQALRTAADVGFRVSQEQVPHGADSFLANSGFTPRELEGGGWKWGYTAAYAAAVEEGTRPHYPPIKPLRKWARRVLGDESAAYAVQQKIAEEGTDAQPYVQPGIDAQIDWLDRNGIAASVEREL